MRNRKMRERLIGWACLITALIAAGLTGISQTVRVPVAGTVTDDSGAVISNASVELINEETGERFRTTSNAGGEYSFTGVKVGRYRVVVNAAGFKTAEVRAIVVSAPGKPKRTKGIGPVPPFDEPIIVNVQVSSGVRRRAPEAAPPEFPRAEPAAPPSQRPSPAAPPVVEPLPVPSLPDESGPPALRRMSFTNPAWNVWAERSAAASFQPVSLQRGLEYSLVVNLAALQYRETEGAGVYSQDASAAFSDWVDRNSGIDSSDVEVLVLPHRGYFQVQGERVKRLPVDLKKFRAVRKSGFTVPESAFAYLRSSRGEAPFSFGIQSFRLRVLPGAPLGHAPVALSFWADGKPVDEVAVNLCVAAEPTDSCATSAASSAYTLRGVDLSAKGNLPDGALHIIERSSEVIGVFRCNTCWDQRYFSWSIGQEAEGWLANRLNETVQRLTPPVPSQDRFIQEGDALYNLIFPNTGESDLIEAERAFRQFFDASYRTQPMEPPASLFMRFVPSKPGLIIFPLALIRVPLSSGSKAFLGFSVNIEAPLELQDYSNPPECISDWVLFVPPEDFKERDLAEARDYANASGWISQMGGLCEKCIYTDPIDFSDWLLGNTQLERKDSRLAVVVLSQYKNNSLFFSSMSENPPSVPAGSIRRKFAASSFAVLDACGTAAPGGSEFIRGLNSHGISSLISTSAAIPGAMAGQFLKIFTTLLQEHREYTVSRARFEAVKLLRDITAPGGQTYGAQALAFALVGNGSLRVCMPQI